MNRLTITDLEHGVAIPCGTQNRIPAAAAALQRLGRRGMHYGWPGMTLTKDGDMLVSASERIHHVCPFGRLVTTRSKDRGRSWSEPQVIFDSTTDDRDVALNTMPDGTVLATWFSSASWMDGKWFGAWKTTEMPVEWQAMANRVTPDSLRAMARGWLRRSKDGGQTWEEEIYPTIIGQHAGPTSLADGSLVYLGPLRDETGKKVVATRSLDSGKTWQIIGEIPGISHTNPEHTRAATTINENHVIETAPGSLLAAFRTHVASPPDTPFDERLSAHTLHFTRSSDSGCTWSIPEDSGVPGYPPYLLRLQSGAILCVFSNRCKPRSIRTIVSYDNGKSWDIKNTHILRELDYPADMGYPVAVETAPGEVFCIYYAIPELNHPGYDNLDMNQWGILSVRFKTRAPASY